METKGICSVCSKVVRVTRLRFAQDSGVVVEKDYDEHPILLCVSHAPKEGCEVTETVSLPSGKVISVHCRGSLRPPQELVH